MDMLTPDSYDNSRSKTRRVMHTDVHFPDGDIILEAHVKRTIGSPSGTWSVLFRVHKFLLSLHSPMFRDMFALPCPTQHGGAAEDDKLDGCVIVHMADDEPGHLSGLLKMLYNPAS